MSDGRVVIDSRIDDSGVTRGIRAIKSKLKGLNTSLIKTAALGAALSISTSLVPAIVAAGGATMALSSSLAAAGAGAVAFGAVAVGVLSKVFTAAEEVQEIEDKIANAETVKEKVAAQKELAALYNDMSDSQRYALKELKSFKSFWSDFTKKFEEPVLNSFGLSLNILKNILNGLAPTITNVSSVVVELLESLDQDIANGGFAKFFKWLENNAAESLYSFAQIAGNTLVGFFNLLEAFSPLGASMEEGLVNLTEKFKEWSASLNGSEGFQKFVDYVKSNGSTLLSILGNLIGIIIEVGTALSPLGEIALNVLDILTSFLVGDLLGAAEVFKRTFGEDALNAVMSLFSTLQTSIETAKPYLATLKEFIVIFIEATVERFKLFSSFIVEAFQIIWTYVQPLVMEMVAFLNEKLQVLVAFWQENGAQIMQATENAFNFILQIIEFIMPAVVFIVEGIWSAIKNIFNGALNIIMGALKIFAGLFTGDWSKLWEGVKQLLSGSIELIWGLIQVGFLGKIFKVIKSFGSKTVESFLNMVKGSKRWIDDLLSNASSKFNSIREKIVSPIRSAREKVIGYIEDLYIKALYKWDDLKSAASSKFAGIKNAVINPISEAKDKIKGILDSIKGFFQGLSLRIPRPKLPKFSMRGKLDLMPPGLSVPSFHFDGWKANGGLFPANSPRLIGIGDAKVPEAALPLKPSVLGMIGQKIADTMPGRSSESRQTIFNVTIPVKNPRDARLVSQQLADLENRAMRVGGDS
jgi:phage-related protein